MLKNFFVFLLAFFCLCACGSEEDNDRGKNNETTPKVSSEPTIKSPQPVTVTATPSDSQPEKTEQPASPENKPQEQAEISQEQVRTEQADQTAQLKQTENEQASAPAAESSQGQASLQPALAKTGPADLPALLPREVAKADKILAFSNHARDVLSARYNAVATALHDNARSYLETWHLPRRPKMPLRSDAAKKLASPHGLFNEDEERLLADNLADMDKALAGLFGHYASLEKYVADEKIRDDGKRGEELGKKIAERHAQFLSARDSWLQIVEKQAADAEEKLLRGHPLQRQIIAAQNIFAQIREIAAVVGSGSPNMEILAGLRQSLNAIVAEGAKPPFTGAPGLERLYRQFLGQARNYIDVLDRDMAEGFYKPQKRELNRAATNCRKAYNLFAKEVNRIHERGSAG